MIGRFTDQARHMIVLAQDEARLLSHDWIGTEHLLLGLIREKEGGAAEALEALGLSLADARGRVEEITGRGEGATPVDVRFTPRAKTVLENSLRESLRFGDDRIGTEHILLSLAGEPESQAGRVLSSAGAAYADVRGQVIRLRARGQDPDPDPDPG